MIDAMHALRPLAWSFIVAASAGIAMTALLRPAVRRFCGAGAVLSLWWIVPLALAAMLLPKHATAVHFDLLPAGALVAAPIAASFEKVPAAFAIPWAAIGLGIWLAGALAVALRLWFAQRRFLHRVTWHGRRGVLPAEDGPAMTGILAPRLVLPADFKTRYSRTEARLILSHEIVHWRRRDALANLAMAALLVLQWFNPLVHWACRALGKDQECACDAVVIRRHPQRIKDYASALLKTSPETRHLPLVCRWHSYHPTIKRIAMLKLHRHARSRRWTAGFVLALGASLASMLTYAARTESTPDENARKFYRVKSVISLDGRTIASPTMIVQDGQPSRITVGERNPDPGAAPPFDFGMDLRVSSQDDKLDLDAKIAVGEQHLDTRMRLALDEQGSYTANDANGRPVKFTVVVQDLSPEEDAKVRTAANARVVSAERSAQTRCTAAANEDAMKFLRSKPAGVAVTSLRLANGKGSLTGRAASADQVSALMRELSQSTLFRDPNLLSMTRVADSSAGASEFKLEFAMTCADPARHS